MSPVPDHRGPRDLWLSIGSAGIAATLAFLPFARGVWRGESLYFRDLAVAFFPLRLFVIDGLRHLELRFWNPYVHGGMPMAWPPVAYPFDLLQVLAPSEWGLSLSLALHFPLAAVAFFVLARSLGLARIAAMGGAVVYSLGGFALSTVNLYVYLQALAWAPLVVWALMRAAGGTSRQVAVAAVLVGISMSTLAVEIVAQTLFIGALLALPAIRPWAAVGHIAVSGALGAGLVGALLVTVSTALPGSARAAGFPTEVVLAHSVHPMTLIQVVVGSLYGDPYHLADRFWGGNFFPRGFPYLLSLYLGGTTLALAFVGSLRSGSLRWRLLAILSLALVVCVGRWAGLAPVVETLPFLRRFRYPSKAFFSVHVSIALLTAFGLDAVVRSTRGRTWRTLAMVLAGLATLLIGALALPALTKEGTGWFLVHFFPPDAPLPQRITWLRFMLADAAAGGFVVGLASLIAFLAARGNIRSSLAAAALVTLLAADLLRTGAGLNPTVTSDFFAISAETRQWVESVHGRGRIFTCDVSQSRSYLGLRSARPDGHEAWTFALLADSLSPLFNMGAKVGSALSLDLTMFVPVSRISSPSEASCRDLPPLLPRLRAAGVTHVLSVDPLSLSDLTPSGVIASARTAPALIHTYSLRGARPLLEIDGGTASDLDERPGLITFQTQTWVETNVRVDVMPHAGWKAQVDGQSVLVVPSSDDRLTLPLGPGHHRVDLRFHPLGLTFGLATSGASLLAIAIAWRIGRREAGPRHTLGEAGSRV